jgi:hypothetical protein
MTKKELIKIFEECEKTHHSIRVELTTPNNDIELVITNYKSLESKKRYYDKFFNNDLVNTKNDKIKIIDARPIQIKKEVKRITIWEEIPNV